MKARVADLKAGFFVIPADTEVNNERVFVVMAAAQEVSFIQPRSKIPNRQGHPALALGEHGVSRSFPDQSSLH